MSHNFTGRVANRSYEGFAVAQLLLQKNHSTKIRNNSGRIVFVIKTANYFAVRRKNKV